jgi:signal transduction histidine kinase
VIHTLFGIGLHLQGASEGATGRVKLAIDRAVADIDQAITEVRDLVFRHRLDETP